MQAADLLSLLVPGLVPGAQPGVGVGVGVGKGGLALGKAAQGEGGKADASNPFAEALAALMAAQGQIAPTTSTPTTSKSEATTPTTSGGADASATSTTPATPSAPTNPAASVAKAETGGAEPAPASDPADKGLQTALAATAKAGAQAKGLAKAFAGKTGSDLTAPEIQPHASEAAPDEATVETAAAKTLPEQSKAAEALANRLATPSPRSDHANEVANGPKLPAWARPATPTVIRSSSAPPAQAASATASPPTDPPAVAETAEAAPPPATTPAAEPAAATIEQAATGLAGAQVAAKTTDPAPSPRADGKAKGKDKPNDDGAEIHAPRGIGKGLATAPGQLKKASSEQGDNEPPPSDAGAAQTAAADKPAGDNSAATPLAAADAARANILITAHTDRAQANSQTVAHLAEQIVSKADGKSTRFDVTLDPAGLGKVEVKIEIGRDGGVNAALTFDNPQAAAELRSRAGELRTALEQAGFDLSKSGLSFDFSGQNQGRNLWDHQGDTPQPRWARASFTDLSAVADAPGLSRHRSIDASGVDVTV